MPLDIDAQARHIFLALLRDIRQEQGLLQQQIADRLGVPQSFVSKYESGFRRLDTLELRQVCQALEISLDDFIRRLEIQLATGESSVP